MKLKKYLFTGLSLVLSSSLIAKTKVDVKASIKVYMSQEVSDAHCPPIIGCDKTYDGFEGKHIQTYSASLTGNEMENEILSLGVSSPHLNSRFSKKDHYRISFKDSTSSVGDEITTILTLDEFVETNLQQYYYRGDSTHNTTREKLQSHSLNGKVDVELKVPENVRLIELISIETSGFVSAALGAGLKNNLNPLLESSRYLWKNPGQEIVFSIPFDEDLTTIRKGSLAITYRPIIGNKGTSKNVVLELEEKLTKVLQLQEKSVSNKSLTEKSVFESLAGMLTRAEQFKTDVSSVEFETLSKVLKKTRYTIDLPQITNDPSMSQNLRAVLSFLMYEIANAYVQNIAEYCGDKVVKLAFSGKVEKVKGINYVYYLVNQMLNSIGSFPVGVHEAYLKLFEKEFQEKEMTYAEVLSESSRVVRLREAHRAFKTNSISQDSFFLEATKRLENLLLNFKNTPASFVMEEHREGLGNLYLLEMDLLKEENRFVRSFSNKNNELVDVSMLLKKLDHIKNEKDRIGEAMTKSLLSIKSPTSGLKELLARLQYDILYVLKSDSKSSFFESLRQAYIPRELTESNIDTVNQCIGL